MPLGQIKKHVLIIPEGKTSLRQRQALGKASADSLGGIKYTLKLFSKTAKSKSPHHEIEKEKTATGDE